MTHFLNSRFAFFYLRRDRSQKETDAQGYQNAVQKIGSFDSVEGFFGIYDHLVKPHSLTSESHVTDYHLFREGISPTWEDPKNRNGGKWIVRLRKVEGLASLYWEDLIMALVGEQFGDVGVQVCPSVLRRLHFIQTRRLDQRRCWVVSCSILGPFGHRDAPRRSAEWW